ncbi:MAG: DUF1062 domain-containing protein [Firmicutes bacterium]|nr:DUF1062 domain-containing protein [Bacillota bacterium]
MEKNIFYWELNQREIEKVYRYCPRCKSKVTFYDSLLRRHNANGKSIFKYAIYKCSKGHTYNKIINRYKSSKVNELNEINTSSTSSYLKDENFNLEKKEVSIEKILVKKYKEKNFKKIKIVINGNANERLDKLLGDNILDYSRNQIQTKIKKGKVIVNDKKVKPKYRVNDGDYITFCI